MYRHNIQHPLLNLSPCAVAPWSCPAPQSCAQLLLTADNLAVRGQYLAARTTFTELLSYGVVPVVNENVS